MLVSGGFDAPGCRSAGHSYSFYTYFVPYNFTTFPSAHWPAHYSAHGTTHLHANWSAYIYSHRPANNYA